jgi:hypothetical protein
MQGFLMQGGKTVQKAIFANQVLEISPTGLKGDSINQDLEQEANQKEDSANRKHLDPEAIDPKGVSINLDLGQVANLKEDSANRKHLDPEAIGLKGVSINRDLGQEANPKEDSANQSLVILVKELKGVSINRDLEQEANRKEDSANQSLAILVKEGNSARMVPVKKTRAGDLEKIPDQGHLTEIRNLLATVAIQGPGSKKVRLAEVSLPPKTVLEFNLLNR